MLRHLITKEVFNNISNFRFMVSSLIALLLILLTTFIISERYMKEVDQYNEFIAADHKALSDVKVFSQLHPNAHRPPNPLIIFDSGISKNLDTWVGISHAWVPRQGLERESENPFMNIFDSADLMTIFRIVFSLLAILMVYDAVAGEREDGTLSAILANAVPRDRLLLSKIIAGFIGIFLAMMISLLISLLVMVLVYDIGFSTDQWLRIVVTLISSLLYTGFFLGLGLLVSSRVKTASISLIWLLFIWVFTVIVQPNLSTYIGSATVRIPSRQSIEATISRNREELSAKRQEIEDEIRREVPGEASHSDHDGGWPYYYCFDGNTVGLLRYVYRTRRMQPLAISSAEKEYRLYHDEYEIYLDRQLRVQHLCNYLSPAGLFSRITAALAESDITHHEIFMDQARQYRHTFVSYLTDDKKVFSDNAYLYFTQQTMEQIENSNFPERLARYRRGEPFVYYGRDNSDPLDLSDMPQFTYIEPGLDRSLHYVLPDLAVLMMATVLVFFLSVISFHRYDVRYNS